MQLLRAFYRSSLNSVDFCNDPDGARTVINRWVSARTHGRIVELLPPGEITADTRLVLTNAVCFKAQWRGPFEEGATRTGLFYGHDSHRVDAQMMRCFGMLRYTEDERAQVLELPYAGDRFAMLLVLPRGRDALRALEERLSVERFSAWRNALSPAWVKVTLPRFSIRKSLELVDTLTELGMGIAFAPAADFSGFTNDEPLMLGQVRHEAFVDVDEKGTEAAVATAVEFVLGGVQEPIPLIEVEFRADHPFLFSIVSVASGAVLFLGRVHSPDEL